VCDAGGRADDVVLDVVGRSGHWALRAERTFGRVTVRREGLA
jgi:hypothetical protein